MKNSSSHYNFECHLYLIVSSSILAIEHAHCTLCFHDKTVHSFDIIIIMYTFCTYDQLESDHCISIIIMYNVVYNCQSIFQHHNNNAIHKRSRCVQ